MNGRDHELPALPVELEEGMRALRRQRPPEALVERAFERLPPRAAMKTHAMQRSQRPSGSKLSLIALGFAAAAAAGSVAGVALYLDSGDRTGKETASIERNEERSVDLPLDGDAWTDLDLWTHHHADQPAVVHVEVPENVSVSYVGSDGNAEERQCQEARCVHRFTHRHGNGVPLRVAVAQPGRYEIRVHHESNEARVRERFVLTAMRD
jgi:hypothetical protein